MSFVRFGNLFYQRMPIRKTVEVVLIALHVLLCMVSKVMSFKQKLVIS